MLYPDAVVLSVILFLAVLAVVVLVTSDVKRRIRRLEREVDALRALVPSGTSVSPAAPAESATPTSEAPDRTLAAWFERLVGGRLLIWVGGIALAAGGVFLIRHSIALVTPEARMIAAALLGLGLIGIGDYARGGRWLADDPRIGQALVGAGIAVLYATAYGSHILFGLIGGGTAFALMVAITAAALGLAPRHGAPAAVMGLAGGFLTPLLVGERDADAVQVLTYLALLDVALFAVAWRRKWHWLGAAALAGSFAWTGYFVLGPREDALPAGLFAAVLGIAAVVWPAGPGRWAVFLPPVIIALIELALLVGRSDIGPIAWLLFGAVAAASLVAGRRPEQHFVPAAALLIALILIAVTAAIGGDPLVPWAAAAATLLFAGASVPAAAAGRTAAALTACAALGGPLLILRAVRPALAGSLGYGMLFVALGAVALGLLWLIRGRSPAGAKPGPSGFGAAATATLLLAIGGYELAPRDLVSAIWLALATGLLLAGIRWRDTPLRVAALALLTATVVKVFLIDAAALEGVLRILSFLGLGIALIGIGLLYGKVLGRKSPPGDQVSATLPRTVAEG